MGKKNKSTKKKVETDKSIVVDNETQETESPKVVNRSSDTPEKPLNPQNASLADRDNSVTRSPSELVTTLRPVEARPHGAQGDDSNGVFSIAKTNGEERAFPNASIVVQAPASEHLPADLDKTHAPDVRVKEDRAEDQAGTPKEVASHESEEAASSEMSGPALFSQMNTPIHVNGKEEVERLADEHNSSVGSSHSTAESKDDLIRQLQASLDELRSEKDKISAEKVQVDIQYKNLFSRVTQMKSTLGARLKQDSEKLAQNRTQIEELEAQNAALSETIAHMQAQAADTVETHSVASRDLATAQRQIESLNTRLREAEDSMIQEQRYHQEALDKSAMVAAEWENLAVEERSARDTLRDRIHDLEEQLASQNTAYENLRNIVSQDDQTIAKFRQTMLEMQESHRVELQEMTDSLQSTIDQLRSENQEANERQSALRNEVRSLNADLEKSRPYEQEVKEKNLLVGKLRHEAVILNEHLTKALRLLKRGTSNDSVDRHLLNNLLLSFFQLPRQDSKRFEVLRILASVLAWDETQKEQAGLIRPGTSLSTMSITSPPSSPMHTRGSSLSRRTSGTLQLQAVDFMGPNRESMSDLWINFLESEAAMEAAEKTTGL